ncbi:MAG: hypothetical protein LUM44_08720 [Pyrinomonadaceae bacterium]|nr:hypothetical protein [Pyrinomonadaceae bacterium]
MQTADWQKIEKIFFKAVSLPAEEQLEFVKKCSDGNDELYCEVCLLIDKDSQSECFLDNPIFKTGTKILASE